MEKLGALNPLTATPTASSNAFLEEQMAFLACCRDIRHNRRWSKLCDATSCPAFRDRPYHGGRVSGNSSQHEERPLDVLFVEESKRLGHIVSNLGLLLCRGLLPPPDRILIFVSLVETFDVHREAMGRHMLLAVSADQGFKQT